MLYDENYAELLFQERVMVPKMGKDGELVWP